MAFSPATMPQVGHTDRWHGWRRNQQNWQQPDWQMQNWQMQNWHQPDEWYKKLPQFVSRCMRADYDDTRVVPHHLRDLDRQSARFKNGVFHELVTAHLEGIRSPFYVFNATPELAQSRLEAGKRHWRFKTKPGYLVTVNLWELAASGNLQQEDVIDLSTFEKQSAYFLGLDCHSKIKSLAHAREWQEILVCWKGSQTLYDSMSVDRPGSRGTPSSGSQGYGDQPPCGSQPSVDPTLAPPAPPAKQPPPVPPPVAPPAAKQPRTAKQPPPVCPPVAPPTAKQPPQVRQPVAPPAPPAPPAPLAPRT